MTSAIFWSIVVAGLGIIGTIVKFKLDPNKRIDDQLKLVRDERKKLKDEEDEILAKKTILRVDNDRLTYISHRLVELRQAEDDLLQRRSKSNG